MLESSVFMVRDDEAPGAQSLRRRSLAPCDRGIGPRI